MLKIKTYNSLSVLHSILKSLTITSLFGTCSCVLMIDAKSRVNSYTTKVYLMVIGLKLLGNATVGIDI